MHVVTTVVTAKFLSRLLKWLPMQWNNHACTLFDLTTQRRFSTTSSLTSRWTTAQGSSFPCPVESKHLHTFFNCPLIATIDSYLIICLPIIRSPSFMWLLLIVLSAALMVALCEDVAIVESSWWLICPRAQMRVILGCSPFGVDRLEHSLHPSRLIMTFYLWVL